MKKGDRLIWQVDDKSYAAKPGARAVVTEDCRIYDEFVRVRWIDDLSNGQSDGGYFPYQFKKEEL